MVNLLLLVAFAKKESNDEIREIKARTQFEFEFWLALV